VEVTPHFSGPKPGLNANARHMAGLISFYLSSVYNPCQEGWQVSALDRVVTGDSECNWNFGGYESKWRVLRWPSVRPVEMLAHGIHDLVVSQLVDVRI